MTGSGDLLGRVAAYGLPGHDGPIRTEPLEEDTWRGLTGQVHAQRLQGFLLAAIDGGSLPATQQQYEHACQLHLDGCSSVLLLEQRLLDVADILESHGIDLVVLKGSAHAHLAYPDPSVRCFGDLDLLIRAEQLERALAVLTLATDATREVPELRAGYDRRYQKSVTLRTAEGIELDVHRTLLFGTFAFRFDPAELFDAAVPLPIGGETLRALSPEHRVLHACFHTAFGDFHPRYSSVRDLAQMLLTGDHDTDRLLAIARRWDAEIVLARGIELCRSMLDVEVAGPVAAAVAGRVPTRREARAIACYASPNHRHTDKVLASLPYVDGAGARLAFLYGSAVPSREFRNQQSGSTGWFRRGRRALSQRLQSRFKGR